MNVKDKQIICVRIKELRFDALRSEKENKGLLEKDGTRFTRESDKSYWNGYLDALTNTETEIKKIK